MITGSQGSGDDHFRVSGLVDLGVQSHLHQSAWEVCDYVMGLDWSVRVLGRAR
jgi:hypothetical protein